MTPYRHPANPIITPAMLRPSRPELRVVGVFNPAVIRHDGETLLLLRVAEAPTDVADDEVAAPLFDAATGRLEIRRWPRDTTGLDASDPRLLTVAGRTWLTSISHLRLARSSDGVRFEIEQTPALSAVAEEESFGVEDARITLIAGTYWINYTAVSSHGIATALASTRDFRAFARHGIIFAPDNRDVAIFPAVIDGRFLALHRPMTTGIGTPSIWTASSSDLLAWGTHRPVAGARPGMWDDAKIGGGAVPFPVRVGTQDAWLALYHGVTARTTTYSLGALLLDAADPSQVLARSRDPVLTPEAPYEREGFFGGVVFTCGLLTDGDLVRVYYGAADGVTALADLSLSAILAGLE